jgi:hypothetical protein
MHVSGASARAFSASATVPVARRMLAPVTSPMRLRTQLRGIGIGEVHGPSPKKLYAVTPLSRLVRCDGRGAWLGSMRLKARLDAPVLPRTTHRLQEHLWNGCDSPRGDRLNISRLITATVISRIRLRLLIHFLRPDLPDQLAHLSAFNFNVARKAGIDHWPFRPRDPPQS